MKNGRRKADPSPLAQRYTQAQTNTVQPPDDRTYSAEVTSFPSNLLHHRSARFFFSGKIRWIGLPIALLGLFAFLTVAKPDILISNDGKVFAVRLENDRLALSDKTANTMASDTWLRRNGQNPNTDTTPRFNQKTAWIKGKKIAFSSLACADADLSILTRYEIGDCPAPVLKQTDFQKNKTHAIYIENGEINISWITKNLRNRPWVQFLLAPSEKTNYIGE